MKYVNQIIFSLFFVVFSIIANGQTCIPGELIITTQAELDNFSINYPGCNEVEGILIIDGYQSDITNLSALSQLVRINHIEIRWTGIASLAGLDNVIDIEVFILYANNELISMNNLNANLTEFDTVEINCRNLPNLSGLQHITSINSLLLENNDVMNTLSGLDNLIEINDLSIINYRLLTSVHGLENINGDLGALVIKNNGDLLTIHALSNIQSAESIEIDDNDSLFGISALESIHTITGDLIITRNENLQSIAVFQNLTSCGGIAIGGNYNLNAVESFDNLTHLSGDLVLGSINTVDFSTFQNIHTIEGILSLNNLYLENLTQFSNVQSMGGLRVSWLNSLSSFSGIEQISSFEKDLQITHCNNPSLNYSSLGNITSVGGVIEIGEMDHLESLFMFNDLEHVGGLNIYRNASLLNLNGLENITSIDNDIKIRYNADLVSLHGFPLLSLLPGDFELIGNSLLSDISMLQNVVECSGNFVIDQNYSLIALTGLENLTVVHEGLKINKNQQLVDITALSNVQTVGGEFRIYDNNLLEDLTGIENIDPATIDKLSIVYNDLLSTCNIAPICTFIETMSLNDYAIALNAPGCNSRYEVADACGIVLDIDDTVNTNEFTIFPNPTSGPLTINTVSQAAYRLYNMSGQLVNKGVTNGTLDISGIAPGVYFLNITIENSNVVKKVVVQ